MEIDPSAPGPPPIWEIEDTAQTSYESIYGYDVDAQLHYNPLRIPSGFGRDIFHDPRYEEEPDSYAVATMKFNTLYRQVEVNIHSQYLPLIHTCFSLTLSLVS